MEIRSMRCTKCGYTQMVISTCKSCGVAMNGQPAPKARTLGMLRYSLQIEEEADREGIRMLMAARINPHRPGTSPVSA